MEREAADPAVEVVDRRRCELVDPGPGGAVERGGDVGVGLEEAARTEVQGQAVDLHRQRRVVGQHQLALTLEQRGVRGLDVERHHPQCRQCLEQPRQVLADACLSLGGAQHPTRHQLTGRRLGDQQVLELAAARGHVVRRQRGARHERREDGERGLDPGGVECAVTEVHGAPAGIPEPEGRSVGRPPDHHLRLGPEPRRRARDRRQPLRLRPTSENRSDRGPGRGLLDGELVVVRPLQPGAGPAPVSGEVRAVQQRQGGGHGRIQPTAREGALVCGRGHRTGAARGGARAQHALRAARADRGALPRARALRRVRGPADAGRDRRGRARRATPIDCGASGSLREC